MANWVDKIRTMMLGADEEEYDDYEEVEETAPPARDSYREKERDRSRDITDLNYVRSHKSAGSSTKVVDYQANIMMQVVITTPEDVNDAFSICDFIKDNRACVVNLEGVEKENAQRIADFLGGVSYALGGEIQRVSNEIFIMAPANVQITGELKDEVKSGSFFPILNHSFR